MIYLSGRSRISPRRGHQLPGEGCQHTNLSNFPKNCMKLKEFGPPGGTSLVPPRSATVSYAQGSFQVNLNKTRMHSSRMRTTLSLTISHRILRMPPRGKTTHAVPPEKPRMLPQQKPCMPPSKNHACIPWQKPHMPPQQKPHMPPSKNHAHPPGKNHAHPLAKTTHTPQQKPCTPRSNHTCPPVNRITDACENITFANYVCGS